MNKYNKYEDWVKVIKEDNPETPKIITNDWLKEQLLNRKNYFRNWGFCFDNLSDYVFSSDIEDNIVSKVPWSTRTVFPNNHPFHFNDSIYHVEEETRNLHNQGIDGRGVNIAVIDFAFEIIPDELKECIVFHQNCKYDYEVHFHGTTVATQIAGKNLGVAPKANIFFYGTRQTKDNIMIDDYDALCDIYEKNKKGANIKIINISASKQRENEKYNEIINKLLEQGCNVIDSLDFAEYFTSINRNPNTGKLYYSDWQEATMEDGKYNEKIAIITGGKMTPLVTTEHDYLYCGQATYSWAIPKLTGFFALALQIQPDLTYDEFIELAISTKIEQNGITLFNMPGIINKLTNSKIK